MKIIIGNFPVTTIFVLLGMTARVAMAVTAAYYYQQPSSVMNFVIVASMAICSEDAMRLARRVENKVYGA